MAPREIPGPLPRSSLPCLRSGTGIIHGDTYIHRERCLRSDVERRGLGAARPDLLLHCAEDVDSHVWVEAAILCQGTHHLGSDQQANLIIEGSADNIVAAKADSMVTGLPT